MDLLVVKNTQVGEIPGGLSRLATHVLKVFCGTDVNGYNMERLGVRVDCPRGPTTHVRARFAVWLLDERAEKALASVKGSSGSKPCMSCRNCVGRIDPARVAAPFQHFSSPGLAGFQLHTYDSFRADAEFPRGQHGVASRADFQRMEQPLGIVHDAYALPWGCMEPIARIPWNHIL